MNPIQSLSASAALALLAVLAPMGAAQTADVPLFEMIDIGDLGGPSSMALDISEQRIVVGEADTQHLRRRAYRWSPLTGILTALDGFTPGLASSAWALNEDGLVVGYARNLAWDYRPVLWSNDVMTDLCTLGGPEGFAFDVNADGVIVGTADSETWGHPRPFVMLGQGGEMIGLPTPGLTTGTAFGINDAGQVVGKYSLANGEHAAKWEQDPAADGWLLIDLHPSRGLSSGARAINELGDVAGWAQQGQVGADPGAYHAQLWLAEGPVLDLGTLPGMRTSRAYGLNAQREVVGSTAGDFPLLDRAFYWSLTTGLMDLNDLVGNPNGRLMLAATGINDAGDIIGYVADQGTPRGVLLRRVE